MFVENKSNMENKFEKLLSLNVNDKLEEKNKLKYLSWSYAWAEFKKEYNDADYKIKMFGDFPYTYDSKTGYMVFTTVTAGGVSHDMWLPVMDGANKSMKDISYTYRVKDWNASRNQKKEVFKEKTCEAANMFDINKAIMRCLVKNLAMFGLGLYVYSGEDLPEESEEQKELKKTEIKETDTAFIKKISDWAVQNSQSIIDIRKHYRFSAKTEELLLIEMQKTI